MLKPAYQSYVYLLLTTLTLLSTSLCLVALPRPITAQNAAQAQPPPPPKPTPEVQALLDAGLKAQQDGKMDEAEKQFTQALTQSRSSKDRVGEAVSLQRIGNVALARRDFPKALDFFEKELPVRKMLGDKHTEAFTLYNIANVYNAMGPPEKAITWYEQALLLFRMVGDKGNEANTLVSVAHKYTVVGQLQKAHGYYEQALTIFKAINNRIGEANTILGIGNTYWETGRPLKALELYKQVLTMYRAIGSKAGEANALLGIGNIYSETGQSKKALEAYQQALQIDQKSGFKSGEASMLMCIGNVYGDTGQTQKSLEFYQQALPICRTVGDKDGEANALLGIGTVYAVTGKSQQALILCQQALVIYRSIGDKDGEAQALLKIGDIYQETGLFQKALMGYQQALAIFQHVKEDERGEALALRSIGAVYKGTGQTKKALEFYLQALPIYRAVGDKIGVAASLGDTGQAEQALSRLDAAETHFREAVAIQEQFRSDLGGYTEAKSAFLSAHLGEYYQYLALLLRRGKGETAFALVQQTKARALLDLLDSGRVDLLVSLSVDERNELDDLRGQAAFLNAQMVKQGVENQVGAKARFTAFAEQLKQVESKLQTLTDALYARHPDLARKHAAKTTTLADLARFLPTDTALLDYVVVSPQEVRLFVVTAKQGKAILHTYPIKVKYDMLAKQADAFHAACADPRKPYQPEAVALYHLLIAPAEKDIAGHKRLLICPDQALWNVPFAALMPGPSSRSFLADRFEIDYAYSATGAQAALQEQKRTPPSGSILAVANPDFGDSARFGDIDNLPGQRPIDRPSRPFDRPSRPIDIPSRTMTATLVRGSRIVALPGTKREADAIQTLFPDARLLEGDEAQEASVKEQAGNYRYLHFATHGFLNDAAPLLSSVVLAKPQAGSKEDGFLTAREVFDLKLNADIVVLSACNTGRGEVRTGEGIVGLTWAFFVAGARTQIVSQWSVDDAATAELMTAFYRNLKTGKSKGAALRQASLSLLHSSQTRNTKHETRATSLHPYYWAPFTLVGDWR